MEGIGIEDHLSLEDLLLATLDAVSRFRVGQRDTVGRLQHGEWGDWLHRVGLAEAEAEIATTKRAYYDALNQRHRALRALAREGGDE